MQKISQTKKKLFLLHFTLEMIKHTGTSEVIQLEKSLDEEEEKEDKIVENVVKEHLSKKKDKSERKFVPFRKIVDMKMPTSRVLHIPEPSLPPNFQYLRPVPSQKKIDLGKLNPLISDPAVRTIECHGPDQNVLVTGSMGVKKTRIIFKKDEIDDIIERFSQTAKIPTHPGVLKIAVGGIILTAIVSEVIGSRFIIQKIGYGLRR